MAAGAGGGEMSQSLEVTLVLASVELLAQAIREIGATWNERKGVVTDPDGTEVEVRIDAKTQRATLISEGCGSKAEALAGRIAQRYAHARVADELRRKGYQLGQETRAAD